LALMLSRVSLLPKKLGRRWFAAAAAELQTFQVGDKVLYVDPKTTTHKINPYEQDDSLGDFYRDHKIYTKNWYEQTFGTVIDIDEKSKLVKVDFDQFNSAGSYITGTWDVNPSMLSKVQFQTIHDVKMNTFDGKPFNTESLKGKVVVILDLEDRQCPKDSSWLKLKRMYLKFKARKGDEFVLLFFPHWNFDQNEEWLSKKLGLPLGEGVHLMQKLPCNGAQTQPAFQFLKQYNPGRVDWRITQAGASTNGWNGVKWILDKNGAVSQKLLGGSWTKCIAALEAESSKVE